MQATITRMVNQWRGSPRPLRILLLADGMQIRACSVHEGRVSSSASSYFFPEPLALRFHPRPITRVLVTRGEDGFEMVAVRGRRGRRRLGEVFLQGVDRSFVASYFISFRVSIWVIWAFVSLLHIERGFCYTLCRGYVTLFWYDRSL